MKNTIFSFNSGLALKYLSGLLLKYRNAWYEPRSAGYTKYENSQMHRECMMKTDISCCLSATQKYIALEHGGSI